jgi:hypothetical protein
MPFGKGSGEDKSAGQALVKCLKFLDNYLRAGMAKKIRGFRG